MCLRVITWKRQLDELERAVEYRASLPLTSNVHLLRVDHHPTAVRRKVVASGCDRATPLSGRRVTGIHAARRRHDLSKVSGSVGESSSQCLAMELRRFRNEECD